MNYILKNHSYSDDIVVTIMMFYPNEKYIQTDTCGDLTVLSMLDGKTA